MATEGFIPLHLLSRRLGIPETWLKREAMAGRIPTLKVNRRLLFDLEAVSAALAERSAGSLKRAEPDARSTSAS